MKAVCTFLLLKVVAYPTTTWKCACLQFSSLLSIKLLVAMGTVCNRSGRYDQALEFARSMQSQLAMMFTPEVAVLSEMLEQYIRK